MKRRWEELREKNMFRGTMAFHEPMNRHTTLGIGGEAEVWLEPGDPLSLGNVLAVAHEDGIPVTVVGGGSNLLVMDGGIRGVILSTAGLTRVEKVSDEECAAVLFVEAGVSLARILSLSAQWGLTGIEGLAGIPGTLGGALRMNAASYGSEISAVVDSVALMTPQGKLHRVQGATIPFGYRASGLPDDQVVLSANLNFGKDEPAAVAGRIRQWQEKKKQDQPLAARSAGSVFKNPTGASAWRLVDEAGFRGAREGGVQVSELHTNFFINTGGGTAADFLRLAARVQEGVRRRCGVELELEVKVAGVSG